MSFTIQFNGAAQNVTGSQHLLKINGKKILLDCGLFQGRRKDTYFKNKTFKYNPAEIDIMLLSHAHIDHSGNIPNLVKNGFNGRIYATNATIDLCQIMLRDSAYLQEKDIEIVNKYRKKQKEGMYEPLYTIEDAEEAMKHFIGIQYDKTIEITPGVNATYRDAGHILGSSGILLEIQQNGKTIRLGFTGDIGRDETPILRNPNRLRDLDVLIMESTYGNRLHERREEVEEELASAIRETVKRGGKIIIPAFAVGRTQLMVYMFHKLVDQNRIPLMPVFVDSPLATDATAVFRMHPECFDRETYRIFIENYQDPFGFSRLSYTRNVEESKKLNELKEPHIIISASGMAEGGRILHHLKNNIENPKNLILFVGYAAEHTLARKIMNGDETVKIYGHTYNVRAKVKTMDYFSGHADQSELLEYLNYNPPEKLKNLFLVHGEAEQAEPLLEKIKSKGFRNVEFPAPGQEFIIE